jgi:hypothetical protein
MSVTDVFLTSIHGFVRAKDASKLRDWLKVEPPLPQQYSDLAAELKAKFSHGDSLERYIAKHMPENPNAGPDDGDVWPGFLVFMKEYLEFWRDVNFENLLETHLQLSSLAKYVVFYCLWSWLYLVS